MAELIVKAVDATHADPEKDRRGCYKRGMVVAVYPDGTKWGNEERLPKFVIIKIPGVAADHPTLVKYTRPEPAAPELVALVGPTYRRRQWQLRWADLPLAARTTLATDGILTIKAGTYSGTYDFTWAQVRGYFRDLNTGLDESGSL